MRPGTQRGPDEITGANGAGGMGEVYRARDSKLGRDVAIKVLPAEFSRDTERMSRFQREAKVLASLNHPNIAAIYGFEDSQGAPALVMELVEGATPADRIKQVPIPIDEALRIAKQICDALEYVRLAFFMLRNEISYGLVDTFGGLVDLQRIDLLARWLLDPSRSSVDRSLAITQCL